VIRRREFIRNTVAGAGYLWLNRAAPFAATTPDDSQIEVLMGEPLGTISPNIYGHFAENLGGVIYDGIWVGEKSKVPNVNGIRKELVEEMRRIKAPVVRYPGGCFADSYDWRDGIGPADKRPRRTNFWQQVESAAGPASHKYDPNQFGTNEFIQFCKLIGSQPYLAANVRSLPAAEFYRWVEYCNSPAGSTTLADMRAAAGYAEPFGVRYWGVGNESWGCGGNFTAQEYAVEFRRYTAWVPEYGQKLSFVASGPNDDKWDWTRGFLEEIVRHSPGDIRSIFGLGLHYYAWNLSRGRTNNWFEGKGDAVRLGFAEARGEVLLILDSDMGVRPEDVPKFVEALVRGKGEMMNGSRLVYPMEGRAMRFLNLVANKFFAFLFSWVLGQQVRDTLCGTKALYRADYERIAANRAYFGDFDPFGDFDLLFGASRLNLRIVDLAVRYHERRYGETNISRFRHGWLLLQMSGFAARKLKLI
jgi:hypothetical protein